MITKFFRWLWFELMKLTIIWIHYLKISLTLASSILWDFTRFGSGSGKKFLIRILDLKISGSETLTCNVIYIHISRSVIPATFVENLQNKRFFVQMIQQFGQAIALLWNRCDKLPIPPCRQPPSPEMVLEACSWWRSLRCIR